MFSIFNRTPTITLDCFTPIPDLPELFPLKKASGIVPNWWKNLKPTVEYKGINRGSLKMCPGVTDYFKTGFIITCWRDFIIEVNSGIPNVLPENTADLHNPIQWGDEALQGYAHVKLVSPWRIKEKTGCKFLFTNTFWHNNTHQYFIPNGIVNYKYQHATNVNLVVNKNAFPKRFELNAGEPIVHCLPISDKNIKIKMHVVSDEEFAKTDNYHFTFSGNYYKSKKFKKENKND
tara:strand:+ start:3255 stop:3953 length:699 start_codon:yes stop_codon:yes gene_type:complete